MDLDEYEYDLTQIRNIKLAKRDHIDLKLLFWKPHWPYSN